MKAATVEILTEKAQFPPETAVAIAEALDMTITHADLVTVSILDARLAKVDARFAQIDIRFAQIDARFEQVIERFDGRFAQFRSEVKAEMQEIKAELVRWVLLAMLGSASLSGMASAIVDALRH